MLDKERITMKGVIAEKTFVDINGMKQGMFIKGKDDTKPVLLLLHGGPGMSDYFMAQNHPTGLEEEFIVCYWEQRGTGLSFSNNIDPGTMTKNQFVADTIAVTNYLRQRFGQGKIYLMGHSWGSYLGLQTAVRNPELFHAYIAMSQVVDQRLSEKIAYDAMLNSFKKSQNKKMSKKLEAIPIMESDEAFKKYAGSLLRDQAMHRLGAGTTHEMRSVVKGIFFPTLRCTDYTPMERLNIWRGKAFSRQTGLRDEMYAFDAVRQVPVLDIPIYFMAGYFDLTCCYSLQKAYYEKIEAPKKGFYTFYRSAHSPLFEEPAAIIKILREEVLQSQKSF